MNLMGKNPERVLELQQLQQLKRKKGCAVCVKRDLRALALGGLACSIPGNFPAPTYCKHWELDEGEPHGDTKAA